MDKIKVLIVEDDQATAKNLLDYLKTHESIKRVEQAGSVAEAYLFVNEEKTDVVVLDLIMPSKDGYSFLEMMTKMSADKKPDVIVTSAIGHEKAVKRAFDMGAKYYMIKPYENEIMYRRICDVREVESAGGQPGWKKSIDRTIMELFLAIGIPPHLKGYQYLREAIKIVVESPDEIYGITKRLYPAVAKQFHVTPTKVELAIRHVLEVAWQRNRMESLSRVFGCEIYLKGTKPTNGEFIALLADKIVTENAEMNIYANRVK